MLKKQIKYSETNYLYFLFFLMFYLTPYNLHAQDYLFHQLRIEDGLSQSTILASLQDIDGYLWFATRSGLNRYDGYKFVVFLNDPNDTTSISDDAINSLFEDKDGTLWIGTVNGNLNKYDRFTESFKYKNVSSLIENFPEQTDEFYEYPLSFSRNQSSTITTITEDVSGNLWVGTWGNGILQIDKNFKKLNHFYADTKNKNGIPTNRIMSLHFDDHENLWIATFGGGLSKLTINKNSKDDKFIFENFSTGSNQFSLIDSKLLTLFQDSEKNLWIGSYYGGVSFIEHSQLHLPPGNAKIKNLLLTTTKNNVSANTVMALAEDNYKNLWIGTFGDGLIRYNKTKNELLHFYNEPLNINSLGDNDVLSLCVDKSGIIWAGSHLGAGITKIQVNNAMFHHIKHIPGNINSLDDDVVWAIYQDADNILWIGTYKGGLNRYDPAKNKFSFIKHFNNLKSISSNHVRSIKEDKYGNLWVGTYDGGLNILNKKTNQLKVYNTNPLDPFSLGGNQVQDIFIESENTYWIGVFGGGLNKVVVDENPLNKKLKFIKYKFDRNNQSTISDNRVYKIFKSKNGSFWICTYGGGLNSFDPQTGKFKRYPIYPDPEANIDIKNLMTIAEDSDGILWLGSYGGGLTSYDRKTQKFKRYSALEGLTSNVVYGILEDENKNLWISSDDGLFKLNLNTKDIRRFDIQDGVQSLEFSGGAYLKNDKGEMFFGGINGFNYFNPEEIRTNKFIPPIVITSIKVFNERFKGDPSQIILSYKKKFLSFEFSSLDYSDPLDNQYSYILEGLQEEWQFTDASNRVANYTNLSPGTYVFKVKGTNSDGLWSDNYASVKITILSPLWQRWWFIAIAVILLAALIYYISTLRIKNLLAIEKLKSKLAADLHDNVGSGLTEISILSEVASRNIFNDKIESAAELGKISDLSRQLIDNMSDIVWVVNPYRDSLHDLIFRLKDSYNDALNSLGISFKTINIDKIENVKLSMEFKQNLYLIFKEAINNSIKHSKCSKIILDINFRNEVIEISVSDNGNGFDENNIRYGNGIKNIENRAAQIGGKIKIKSSPESGTSIRFIGRLGKINKLNTFFRK